MIHVSGVLVCVQRNGEHIRVEAWVYDAYLRGALNDPMLTNPIRNAVRLFWW